MATDIRRIKDADEIAADAEDALKLARRARTAQKKQEWLCVAWALATMAERAYFEASEPMGRVM